jgi:N-acetylglucosaminyl-diphospho-decaprenol L-rhamnosyltransferase
MRLSIVIVNWNTKDLLAACLASIRSEMPALADCQVETLVVDNASQDGSATYVRQHFPWVRLIENERNVGFAQANNQAIVQAVAQYILLLNSDTSVLPNALSAILAFMETHERAGAVGARLLNSDHTLQPSCNPMLTPEREFLRLSFLDRFWPRASYRMHLWDTATPRQVESMMGACLLLRRSALDEVGLLDQNYFMYTEEIDLCYRLLEAGWELWWVPQAQIVHYGGASSSQMAEEMYLELYRSKVRFYRKFGGPRRANRFKRWLRFVYWPRLAVATAISLSSPTMSKRADLFRRLLRELPVM